MPEYKKPANKPSDRKDNRSGKPPKQWDNSGKPRDKSFGDKPRSFGASKDGGRNYSGNSADKPHGERKFGDNKGKSYSRSDSDRPREFGANKDGGRNSNSFNADRPRSFGDKPSYNKPNHSKPSFQDRNQDHHKAAKPFEPDDKAFDNDPDQRDQNEPREDLVVGRNAVLELLKTDRQIECIYLQKGLTGTIIKIAAIAKDRGLVVKEVAPIKLDHMCQHANHQGVVAQTSAAKYSELEDLFTLAQSKNEPPFIVIADEIEDPHNLGAIIRSAEAAGAHGLIIPKRRSAGLTFVVSKTSAGAAEHLPVVKVANLTTTIEQLKKRGVWIYAADLDGQSWCGADYSGALALVVGSEGSGVSRLVKDACDYTVTLPMNGKINSLNASVAAGIILYEISRQRTKTVAFNK